MVGDELDAQARSANVRVEGALHPWVAYGVMPLFALANAGVQVPPTWSDIGADQLSIGGGILVGLVCGKPIGIVLAAVALVRLGVAELPAGISWRHMAVLGCLGGIGFTMSIFIADLAFADPVQLALAKMAVLAASALAAMGGLLLGHFTLRGRG
jgi:NhaA family Na+:H+ antiporter